MRLLTRLIKYWEANGDYEYSGMDIESTGTGNSGGYMGYYNIWNNANNSNSRRRI